MLPKKIVEEIDKVAKELKLGEEERKRLEKEVERVYLNSRFEPGEAIGILTAQSISEPATQLTMRTYHLAGAAGIKVTFGLPRLIEIFDAKRKIETPMMTVYLKKEYNTKEDAERLAFKIVERRIKDVAKSISIDIGENTLIVEIGEEKELEKVKKAIKEHIARKVEVKVKENSIIIRPKEELSFSDLQKLKVEVGNILVEGIEGITAAIIRKEGENWVLQTVGSNLREVLKLEEVNERKTISNDIYEVYEVLGIEAARNVIVKEAYKTMQEQGLDVDIRYLLLLADVMTWSGEISSIGRYGVAGAKASVLSRAAFEETIKHLIRASIKNEVDEFKGLFENVMVGQPAPVGTGMFELIMRGEENEHRRNDKESDKRE
ncbi:MAG: DNA-directed RNA polymerase subunit A'' [Candidatus Aenigmarchaeota archaeon]|jgi:DNA-directed RNA polymerase subunit A"|nr:DNA-directed RNA polymerase subunit A'' [Candidatus Aenigmarchaeota archaeon]